MPANRAGAPLVSNDTEEVPSVTPTTGIPRLVGDGLVDLVAGDDHRDVVLDCLVLAEQIAGVRALVVADDQFRLGAMEGSLKGRG